MDKIKNKLNFNILVIIGCVLLIPLNLAFSGLIKGDFIKTLFGIIGCAGLPLWAFLIDEGAKYNSGTVKYMILVLVSAVLSAYPYFLCYGEKYFNPTVFFSLAFTAFVYLGATLLSDRFKDKSFKILTFITVSMFLIFLIRSDWCLAIIPGFIVHIYKDKFFKLAYYVSSFSVVFLAVGLFMYFTKGSAGNSSEYLHMISLSGCILSLHLIRAYKNEPVKKPIRFMPYASYIIILIIIFAIKNILD